MLHKNLASHKRGDKNMQVWVRGFTFALRALCSHNISSFSYFRDL
ncbi:Hypothetical protein BN2458_PEG1888 [Helicobacter typhlonius]|uniref:Uncharacterized protein n=1 Tax=Helicobacter typhlonius TaxID=76936 RepID=A0A0S4PWW1_9HELI|nr:Hypothetical protein BN2458_PEG1888 [Helicobacter typhlonius]